MSSLEIHDRVARVIADALSLDEDDVTPSSALQRDLGAESIDFLDLVFRLERTFGIHIPRDELFPESIFQGDPSFLREDMVTDAGMAELRSRMPYANLAGIEKDRRLVAVPDLFTVDLISRYVVWKLANRTAPGELHATSHSRQEAWR